MSINNKFDHTISPEERTCIDAAVANVETALAFLISCTPDERVRGLRMGPASEAFCTGSRTLAKQQPRILPRDFDEALLERDAESRAYLMTVRPRLANLLQRVDDTVAVSGAELFEGALVIYKSAKENGDGLGLEPQINELSKRFKRAKRESDEAAAAE